MHESNRVIQGLWIEGNLSNLEILSLRSFLAQGHEYHLYTYGQVPNIPEGVVRKNAAEILPQDRIFTIQSGFGKGSHGGGFSDLFRYHLLNQRGGWWVDTDIVCLKSFDFEADHVVASSNEVNHGDLPNGCVLKLPTNSKASSYLCSHADQKMPEKLGYPELGPFLVQQMVRELELQKFVVTSEIFCPISWREVQSQIAYLKSPFSFERIIPELKRRILQYKYPHFRSSKVSAGSYAIHLWNEIWRGNGIDKNARFHRSCIFERLKSRYE